MSEAPPEAEQVPVEPAPVEAPPPMSLVATLGKMGISQTTYPFGPNFGDVKPWRPAEKDIFDPKKTTPWDPTTTRRMQYKEPLSPSKTSPPSLRYPCSSAVPSPSEKLPDKMNFTVKLLGAGVDGTSVPVRVRSTGTVADVITTAVANLHAVSGPAINFSNLRVTGLYSSSGRALAPGYRLHSLHQVPFIKNGSTLMLKVFY